MYGIAQDGLSWQLDWIGVNQYAIIIIITITGIAFAITGRVTCTKRHRHHACPHHVRYEMCRVTMGHYRRATVIICTVL